jgi:hypothetical protein
MSFWAVVWVVLMILWLFGGGYYNSTQQNPNWGGWAMSGFLPWVCVAILGASIFGAINVGAIR